MPATTALPIDLPEVTDEMVERATMSYIGAVNYADPCMRTVLTEFRLALLAATPQWQPIERDQIKAGMRIRATTAYRDYVTTRTGEAHHTNESGDWCTEFGWLLTGWAAPISYEVDPATIPADPDADLIEALREASWRIERKGKRPDPLPGLPEARDLLTKLRELGWTVIRESEATA